MSEIPLSRQIICVKREIRMRQRVYPRWVVEGRMTDADCAEEIRAMQAVLATLEQLQTGGQQTLFSKVTGPIGRHNELEGPHAPVEGT